LGDASADVRMHPISGSAFKIARATVGANQSRFSILHRTRTFKLGFLVLLTHIEKKRKEKKRKTLFEEGAKNEFEKLSKMQKG
jgi:hypothetical protein